MNFKLEHLRRTLWTEIPNLLRDLLDIAIYVYAADQALTRGNGGQVDGSEIGAGWRRKLRLRIPVREPDRWNSEPVRTALESVLSFLSEDEFTFEFPHLTRDHPLEDRLDFLTTPFNGHVQDVVLFSGGLDSLAGAVHELVVERRQVLLVNHRSTEKMTARHQTLLTALERHLRGPALLHVPVWVNKAKRLGKESTQRTRSFLFAAVAAVFARMSHLSRIRFYENGVTSLNLPPVGQVVGARASRTTHPRTLAGFGRLFSELFGSPFVVDNPFLWDTKTDVVKRIAAAGCGNLIGLSRSCARTWLAETKTHPHCGVCSQCIDRRFAVMAAGCTDHDPAASYAVDLLTGAREPGEPAVMLSAYLSLVERLETMGEADFVSQFGELARVLPHLSMSPAAGVARVFDLYKRHASQVNGVIAAAIREHADRIRRRTLSPACLLRMVFDDAESTGPATANGRPAGPARPVGNYFLRRGHHWAIRFGEGEEQTYRADIGFAFLHALISHPDREFTASELTATVCRHGPASSGEAAREAVAAGEIRTGDTAPDEVLDNDAVHALQIRLGELVKALPKARASDSEARDAVVERLETEQQQIEDELRRARKLTGGRRAFSTEERERVRKRLSVAVGRALKEIALYDPPLAAHLRRPGLILGHTPRYLPRGAVVWTTAT